jgi:hypothetical protein
MPKYFPKKSTQTESKHVLKTQKNSYLLTIRQSEWSTLLYIGGINYYCLECQVFNESAQANLSKIEYNAQCSLTGKFERGHDTIAILSLLVSYIVKNFKHITSLVFEDYSYRNCSESLDIDLAPFHYALDGKTWYMSKMDAYFLDSSDAKEFQLKNLLFQDSKASTNWIDYDMFVTTEHPLPLDTMKLIFKEASTWSDFFQRLRTSAPIEVLCKYMAPWITNFIKTKANLNFLNYKFAMNVPNPKLPNIEFTIENYASGGGKYTRNNIRKRRGRDLR